MTLTWFEPSKDETMPETPDNAITDATPADKAPPLEDELAAERRDLAAAWEALAVAAKKTCLDILNGGLPAEVLQARWELVAASVAEHLARPVRRTVFEFDVPEGDDVDTSGLDPSYVPSEGEGVSFVLKRIVPHGMKETSVRDFKASDVRHVYTRGYDGAWQEELIIVTLVVDDA